MSSAAMHPRTAYSSGTVQLRVATVNSPDRAFGTVEQASSGTQLGI